MKEIRTFKSRDRDSDAYTEDGGLTWRWCSNDSVIDLDICKDYGIPCDREAQEKARDEYVSRFLESYRRNQPPVPSPEEQYEMRAAFGPGKDVVDVITGRRFRT